MNIKSKNIKTEGSAQLESTEYLDTGSDAVVAIKTYEAIGIEPKMLIQQPHLKLINASLAYEYSDRQTEVGYFIGFICLFIGICISSVTSLILALQSEPFLETAVSIHSSVLSLSVVVVGIFAVLTRRAQRKASEAKILMDSRVDVSEIKLRIVEDGDHPKRPQSP